MKAQDSLIPHPLFNQHNQHSLPARPSIFKKANDYIFSYYSTRKKLYIFLLFSFCLFSVLGFFYYIRTSRGDMPIGLYLPVREGGEISLYSVYLFRRLHLFLSIFVFLCGFSVFGTAAAFVFLCANAFVVGFSVQYSLDLLLDSGGFAFAFCYLFLIALYMSVDMIICCEVAKYTRFAYRGLQELFMPSKLLSYIFTFLIITVFDFLVTYILNLIAI